MDHKLVPSVRVKVVDNEVGRPRVFADDYGVGIACAAYLMEAGLRRERVLECIQILSAFNSRPDSPSRGLTLANVIEKRLGYAQASGEPTP